MVKEAATGAVEDDKSIAEEYAQSSTELLRQISNFLEKNAVSIRWVAYVDHPHLAKVKPYE